MNKAPAALAGLFIAISLVRVAQFSWGAMRAGVLGVLFALGLGAAVFVSSYNVRTHIGIVEGKREDRRSVAARSVAVVCLILFVLADGAFNLWEVLRTVREPDLQFAAWVYGLFPTIASAALGLLQGRLDKLGHPPIKNSIASSLRAYIASMLKPSTQEVSQAASSALQVIAQQEITASTAKKNGKAAAPVARKHCPVSGCSEQRDTAQQIAAHVRYAHPGWVSPRKARAIEKQTQS